MRSRSSIFSSDNLFSSETLATSLWPTRAVVVALAVCVAFRLAIGLLGPGFQQVFGYWLVDTDMGWARVQMERAPVDGEARCLAVGSSRVGLGIHEPTLAEALGWEVIKTPVNAGTPWTFLHMFREEPQLLDGVEAMIVDVACFQFNDDSPVRDGLRFLRLGDPRDPFWAEIARERGYATGWPEYLWPVHRERRELMEVVKGVVLDLSGGRPYRPMDARWRLYDADPQRMKDPGMAPVPAARRVMEDFRFSTFMVETWRELAALCEERGVELFVVYPPVMAAYREQLRSREAWEQHYQRVRQAVAELDRLPGVTVLFTDSLAEIGLADEKAMLMDYGHLTGAGARAYTAWLGAEIQERLAAESDQDRGVPAGS